MGFFIAYEQTRLIILVQLDLQNIIEHPHLSPKNWGAALDTQLPPCQQSKEKRKLKGDHQRVEQKLIHFVPKIHSSEYITPKDKTKQIEKQSNVLVA